MYSMVLAVRLLLAVPVGALLVVALALLVLSLLLQLVWLARVSERARRDVYVCMRLVLGRRVQVALFVASYR